MHKIFIYLVLSSSSSFPAKMIRFFTKNRMNHSSLSLDSSLTCMYSFGRQDPNNMFSAALVTECINKGFYQRFTDTYIRVYRIMVDEEKYSSLKNYLDNCKAHKDCFKYNYIGLALAGLNIPFGGKNSYFCSHFVAEALQKNDISDFNRNLRTYKPHYFEADLADNLELIYQGEMSQYKPLQNELDAVELQNI